MPAPSGNFMMSDSSIMFDATDFASSITKAVLTPDVSQVTTKTLVPDGVIQDTDQPSWKFSITAVQSWGTGGLALALNTAFIAGTDIDVVYQPKAGGPEQASFTIKPQPVDFGGQQGSHRTFDLDLLVVGQPDFTPVAP